ncbi:hypothetical protein [Marivivens niveibacter]|uniref:hypothetical protein n=1 Tax=Marivivens niveibacter TaxID=1930667 RepID=UPI000A398B16|nr:hypothetical protein [Marivivens niveibacter]
MLRRFLILITSLLVLAQTASAQDAIRVEAEGFGFVTGSNDTESARRRALMDALLNASLAGGAAIKAHSVANMGRIERDLLIVRPTGRVLQHNIIHQSLNGHVWTVRIQAMVGNDALTSCQAANRLHIITYQPRISVSPNAPFWTEQVAYDVVQQLYGVLDRHRAVETLRITDRAMPVGLSDARAARDYTVLTQGDVRLTSGDFGFAPDIRVDVVAQGRRNFAQLTMALALVHSDGNVTRHDVIRQTPIPGPNVLGNATAITQRTRGQMITDLSQGLAQEFDDLLSIQSCSPLTSVLAASGDYLSVDVGARQGLTRGAVAFTADHGHSVQMLEIVSIANRNATLRPMDPTVSASQLVGRPVRFLETGL